MTKTTTFELNEIEANLIFEIRAKEAHKQLRKKYVAHIAEVYSEYVKWVAEDSERADMGLTFSTFSNEFNYKDKFHDCGFSTKNVLEGMRRLINTLNDYFETFS